MENALHVCLLVAIEKGLFYVILTRKYACNHRSRADLSGKRQIIQLCVRPQLANNTSNQ